MRLRPYLTLLRRNRAFSRLFAAQLVSFVLAAGMLAERLPPAVAVWSIVGLAAVAAVGWIAFSRPVWRRPHESPGRPPRRQLGV
jgi:O-antigen/teichoic acid export membrane protein